MKSTRTILLVEDNKIEAMKVRRAFKKLGVVNDLHISPNGLEALSYLKEQEHNLPGLILLDLNMPKMNGLEFLHEIKQDDNFKKIPVVVLTTSKNESDRMQSFEHSVAGYMVKPVRYEAYLEVIQIIENYWKTSELPY